MFVENLAILIMKNHFPFQFVKNVWLQHLVLQLRPCVQFLFRKFFSNLVLPELVETLRKHMFCLC